MLHEVTIPFPFDTTPLENMMANVGEKKLEELLEKVTKEGLSKALPVSYVGYGHSEKKKEIDWHSVVNRRIDELLERHSQEIVEMAALMLVTRAGRKKAWRDVLAEVKEGAEDA